jgi:DNA-binding GntR family transcriptional regulator
MAIAAVDRPRKVAHRSASLREQIGQLTKALIYTGELTPGSLISAAQIAERFQVSRTPVREALLELMKEGLLRAEANRGFRVVDHSSDELDQLSDIRLMLEVPAMVRLARMRPPPTAALVRAGELVQALKRAADERDVIRLVVLDREFHLLLVEQCGNPILTKLIAQIRDQLNLPGLQRLARAGRLRERAADEHGELLKALSAGDAAAAARITTAHIKRTRREWAAGTLREDTRSKSRMARGA